MLSKKADIRIKESICQITLQKLLAQAGMLTTIKIPEYLIVMENAQDIVEPASASEQESDGRRKDAWS